MSWVGASHNAVLDAFVNELRKPGVLTRDVCTYLVEFSVRDERIPANRREVAKRLGPASRRAIAAKGLRGVGLCGSTRSSSASVPREPWLHNAAGAGTPEALVTLAALRASKAQSPAAYNLLSQIHTAIDYAADPYDLAGRLRPVLDAARSLSHEEYAAIAATISVAQSSFEYWQAQFPAFQQAVAADYGACATQLRSAGYSSANARDQCLGTGNGTSLGVSRRFAPELDQAANARFILTAGAMAAHRQCPSIGSRGRAGFRMIGRGDVGGAWGGAIHGAIAGGLHGALAGAVLGGGIASAGVALALAWDTYWQC